MNKRELNDLKLGLALSKRFVAANGREPSSFTEALVWYGRVTNKSVNVLRRIALAVFKASLTFELENARKTLNNQP
jgi:hypothetical protein